MKLWPRPRLGRSSPGQINRCDWARRAATASGFRSQALAFAFVNNSAWTDAADTLPCLTGPCGPHPVSARNNRILHIDGDSFFASCEIALNAKLEGRPVWVGGGRRGDGIVIAAKGVGFLEVPAGEEKAFLKDRPVSEMSGIGKNRQRSLAALGAFTFGHVAKLPSMLLRQKFGIWGQQLWLFSNGQWNEPLVLEIKDRTTISSSTTLPQDEHDYEAALTFMLSEATRLAGAGYLDAERDEFKPA